MVQFHTHTHPPHLYPATTTPSHCECERHKPLWPAASRLMYQAACPPVHSPVSRLTTRPLVPPCPPRGSPGARAVSAVMWTQVRPLLAFRQPLPHRHSDLPHLHSALLHRHSTPATLALCSYHTCTLPCQTCTLPLPHLHSAPATPALCPCCCPYHTCTLPLPHLHSALPHVHSAFTTPALCPCHTCTLPLPHLLSALTHLHSSGIYTSIRTLPHLYSDPTTPTL